MFKIDRRAFFSGLAASAALPFTGMQVLAANEHVGSLTITGASTLAPLIQEIAQRYTTLHKQMRIDIQSGGTYRGIADVRRKVADIGMVSRGMNPDEGDLVNTLVGRDGIAMIVHKTNPLSKMTLDQIRAIYRGEVTNWKQVGGTDTTITVVNKAEGRSTLDVFLLMAKLGVKDVKAQVVIGDNEQGIKVVSGNPRSIGYVSIGTAEYQIKAGAPLKMISFGDVAPSTQAVADGTYGATRELNLVTLPSPSPQVTAFLAFAASEQNHDLIREYFFIPPSK